MKDAPVKGHLFFTMLAAKYQRHDELFDGYGKDGAKKSKDHF